MSGGVTLKGHTMDKGVSRGGRMALTITPTGTLCEALGGDCVQAVVGLVL